MKLLLKTHSANEYLDGYDYAVINLTPQFAAWCIGRINHLNAQKQTEAQKSIHEKYYYRSDARFIHIDEDSAATFHAAIAEADDKGIATLPNNTEIPDSMLASTECCQTVIRDDAVSFFCYPRHGDDQITTNEIDLDTLRSAGHPPIGVGLCAVCGHFGEDCTGNAQ